MASCRAADLDGDRRRPVEGAALLPPLCGRQSQTECRAGEDAGRDRQRARHHGGAIGDCLGAGRGDDIVPLIGARRRDRLAETLGALEVKLGRRRDWRQSTLRRLTARWPARATRPRRWRCWTAKRASRPKLRHQGIGQFIVAIDVLDVVMIVQNLDHLHQAFARLIRHRHGGLRPPGDGRGLGRAQLGFQRLAHRARSFPAR